MARVGMLDVSGHESRHSATWGALRFDQQSEFRRKAGARWAHALGQSDDGGGGGNRGTFHRHKKLAISIALCGDGALPRPSGRSPASTQGQPDSMQPFRKHTGVVVPLDKVNVDTDQIIPKQFLKRIERTGFGEFLFYDWRVSGDGKKIANFVLHQPRYAKASILVAGKNFGCGSSREHAVWALADFGFQVVIASSFADIFANNSLKNGLLTVRLNEEQVAEITRRSKEIENYELTVDLETLRLEDGRGFSATFAIDEFSRHCLLNGLDDIGLTLQHEAEIKAYEAKHPVRAEMKAIRTVE